MLNAMLSKNAEKNGFELRLFEKVDEKTFKYLVDEMGMYFTYENFNGKWVTKMWRSFDLTKAQNIKGNGYRQKPLLKCTPEQAYAILEKRVEKVVGSSVKTTTKKTATKSKTTTKKATPSKSKTTTKKAPAKKSEPAFDISKLTKAQKEQLLALLMSK